MSFFGRSKKEWTRKESHSVSRNGNKNEKVEETMLHQGTEPFRFREESKSKKEEMEKEKNCIKSIKTNKMFP